VVRVQVLSGARCVHLARYFIFLLCASDCAVFWRGRWCLALHIEREREVGARIDCVRECLASSAESPLIVPGIRTAFAVLLCRRTGASPRLIQRSIRTG
jgi:hypothetical protein